MSYQSGNLTPEGEYEKELTHQHEDVKNAAPILATGDGTTANLSGAKLETVRNVSLITSSI